MGKLNYTHEDDNIQSVNNQWIITSHYPDYKKFEKLFEQDGKDISDNTTTANGEQIDLESEKTSSKWDDLKPDYLDWVLSKVKSFTLPIEKLKVIRAWTITYNKNGYQGIHVHTGDMDYKTFSVVLHMDDVITSKDNKYDGVLFTLMPEPNGHQHLTSSEFSVCTHKQAKKQCLGTI